MTVTGDDTISWLTVCCCDRVPLDRGAAALVAGRPIALFRLSGGDLYAVDHLDPATGVPVAGRVGR